MSGGGGGVCVCVCVWWAYACELVHKYMYIHVAKIISG